MSSWTACTLLAAWLAICAGLCWVIWVPLHDPQSAVTVGSLALGAWSVTAGMVGWEIVAHGWDNTR